MQKGGPADQSQNECSCIAVQAQTYVRTFLGVLMHDTSFVVLNVMCACRCALLPTIPR
jgi:hypothetical protein